MLRRAANTFQKTGATYRYATATRHTGSGSSSSLAPAIQTNPAVGKLECTTQIAANDFEKLFVTIEMIKILPKRIRKKYNSVFHRPQSQLAPGTAPPTASATPAFRSVPLEPLGATSVKPSP